MSKSDQNLKSKVKLLQKENEQLQSKIEDLEKVNQKSFDTKVSFVKWISSIFIGKGLKVSLNNLYKELPDKVTKETLADVTANIIWRLTRIGLLAAVIALVPICLLYQQNQKIEAQNNLFINQNQLAKEQSFLAEASRRSSLVFMMSNIMDKIDDELNSNKANEEPYHESRKISNVTIGRLAALSQSMKPINYMDSDSIIGKSLSPERGQLLLSLANCFLSKETYKSIYAKCNFEYADLKNARLNHLYLKGARLKGANFSDADLSSINLSEADLSDCNFNGADLKSANLSKADLRWIDLTNSFLAFDVFATWVEKSYIDSIRLKLNLARVDSKNWFEIQKQKNIEGFGEIEYNYYVDPTNIKIEVIDKNRYGTNSYFIKKK